MRNCSIKYSHKYFTFTFWTEQQLWSMAYLTFILANQPWWLARSDVCVKFEMRRQSLHSIEKEHKAGREGLDNTHSNSNHPTMAKIACFWEKYSFLWSYSVAWCECVIWSQCFGKKAKKYHLICSYLRLEVQGFWAVTYISCSCTHQYRMHVIITWLVSRGSVQACNCTVSNKTRLEVCSLDAKKP